MSTWAIFPSEEDIIHKSHKYLDRVRTKDGKWRYIYYKTKKKVRNVLGLNQKKKLEIAGKGLQKAVNKLQNTNPTDYQSAVKNYSAVKSAEKKLDKRKDEFDNSMLGVLSNVKDKGLEIFNSLFGTNFSTTSGSIKDAKSQIDKYDPFKINPIKINPIKINPIEVKTIQDSFVPATINSGSTNKKSSLSTKSTTPTKKSSNAGRINSPQSSTAYQKSLGFGKLSTKGNSGTTMGKVTDSATKKKKRRKA